MGSISHTFFVFVIFFVVSLTLQTVAGRNVPTDAELQPEWLGHDRSFLIPGIGRVIVPKKGSHVKSFHYNPITGAPSGHGVGGSTGGASGRNYVPGGDDTYLPNPGVEVPSPVGGGGVSPPSGH
ncbi:hypothetical protein PHJA_000024100 [Phtheirospermum japonicum]|uniref:Cell wall protein n=1 Tax=Phtheirospermum japonicum TaxID=374723 RepID=A0A830AXQ8_9LAMI|nr:hypothetical protein PHJA_000024100 [Phtheirospermum japonicum]